MAFDFSKLNFFSRLDARARIFVIFACVLAVILLVYVGTLYFSSGNETTGPSRVANVPSGVQSIPGGQLSVEYQRALEEANVRGAEQAKMSGASAIPTLINYGGDQSQCIICSDQSANVKNDLDSWVRQGKLAPEVANSLQQLANKNVSIDEYAAELDRLVREGKLTPEQARLLLEQYKKQHTNALLADSAKVMDGLIKSGDLPLDAASDLLNAQKNNISPANYADQLQRLSEQGKISPATAQRLLAQYTQQRAQAIVMKSVTSLHKMARAGQIIPEVETALVDLEMRMVPLDNYQATLQRFVSQGKLVPAAADKILTEFKDQKAAIGPTASVSKMLQDAEAAAYQELNDLVAARKMSPEVATQLADLIKRNVSLDDYKNVIAQLVAQNKITPDIAKLKIADYTLVKGLREMEERLGALQANNASAVNYADELKRAVQSGILTPEQAAQLMQEYQAITARAPVTVGPGSEDFNRLQERLQSGAPQQTTSADEFAVAQTAAATETDQDRQARIQALLTTMSGQATQLVSAWQPVPMVHKAGMAETDTGKNAANKAPNITTGGSGSNGTNAADVTGIPLIKAGTIIFGVLDTTVNSDYPDSPVMVTIVDGKYKGAKLLGKLTTTKGVSGQMDRVSLNFTLMNMDEWPKSKTVTAYAIDPDTARTVLATNVDYHYLQRFGAIMATSFVQGYANAIATSSSTSTTGIFGTSTTHPELSPGQKLATAVGQIGQNLGSVTQNYVNIPPTVRVDSGVGLGILFMQDVTSA